MIALLLIFLLYINDSIYIKSWHISRFVSRREHLTHELFRLSATKKADIYDKEWDPKLYPKLDFNEDYYKVLEVEPTADQAALKKAYYKMVLKYHPDNRRTDDEKSLGNRQMMVINAAYKILRNDQERAAYDSRKNKKQTSSVDVGASSARSSRAASSSSSYADPSYESPWKPYNNDDSSDSEPSESFLEIFADIFNDLRNNKGVNLMNDLEEFLDNQVGEDVGESMSPKEIAKELETLSKTITNIEMHGNDLKKNLDLEKLLMTSDSSTDLEARYRRNETIKGLEARIAVVDKQLRQLKKRKSMLADASDKRKTYAESSATRSTSTRTTSTPRPNSYSRTSTPDPVNSAALKQKKIDDQLEKLKREMGMK